MRRLLLGRPFSPDADVVWWSLYMAAMAYAFSPHVPPALCPPPFTATREVRSKHERNRSPIMVERKCLEKKDGAMCTLSEGHTGDHVAESGHVGNIIGAWREDESDAGQGEQSPGQ